MVKWPLATSPCYLLHVAVTASVVLTIHIGYRPWKAIKGGLHPHQKTHTKELLFILFFLVYVSSWELGLSRSTLGFSESSKF